MRTFLDTLAESNNPKYDVKYEGCKIIETIEVCSYKEAVTPPGQKNLELFPSLLGLLIIIAVPLYFLSKDIFTKRLIITATIALGILLAASTVHSFYIFKEHLDETSVNNSGNIHSDLHRYQRKL